MAVTYDTFDIQIMNRFSNASYGSTGGAYIICAAGTFHKVVLFNPDNAYASLANPVASTAGKLRFAVQNVTIPITVDIYGVTQDGHAVVYRAVAPGNPTEFWMDSNRRRECVIVPFSVADNGVGAEASTGLFLPRGAVIDGHPISYVTIASGVAAKTVSVGTLSSQTGGNATGLVNGISLTAIATGIATKLAATGTLGALLSETTTGATAVIPVPYVIGSAGNNAAQTLSVTLTAAATLAEGYTAIEYILPLS